MISKEVNYALEQLFENKTDGSQKFPSESF